jgi:co-chaperonin GroES (HSP10)
LREENEMIRNTVIPAPGNIAVLHEHIEETTRGGIIRPEDIRQDMQRVNPWALVVGVGDPRQTQYGTTITTNVKPGDKVLVGQHGREVEIDTPDGEQEFLYVVPFEGILASLGWQCSICGWKTNQTDGPKVDRCINGCKDIQHPTLAETLAAKGPH